MPVRSYVYVKPNENGKGIERIYSSIEPGEGWRKLTREENDKTRLKFESFIYPLDGSEITKIPEVKIVVSNNVVEIGADFSVKIETVDDLGDKDTVGITIATTHYDLEPDEDVIIVEAEEGVYTIILNDTEVWARQELYSVIAVETEE